MHVGIGRLEPCADVNKISAVDGISVIATESHFLYRSGSVYANLLPEEVRTELTIQ
jgi:hypothetical protein